MSTTVFSPGAIGFAALHVSVDPSLLSRRKDGDASEAPVFFTATFTCMWSERSQNAVVGLTSCSLSLPAANANFLASLKTKPLASGFTRDWSTNPDGFSPSHPAACRFSTRNCTSVAGLPTKNCTRTTLDGSSL